MFVFFQKGENIGTFPDHDAFTKSNMSSTMVLACRFLLVSTCKVLDGKIGNCSDRIVKGNYLPAL